MLDLEEILPFSDLARKQTNFIGVCSGNSDLLPGRIYFHESLVFDPTRIDEATLKQLAATTRANYSDFMRFANASPNQIIDKTSSFFAEAYAWKNSFSDPRLSTEYYLSRVPEEWPGNPEVFPFSVEHSENSMSITPLGDPRCPQPGNCRRSRFIAALEEAYRLGSPGPMHYGRFPKHTAEFMERLEEISRPHGAELQ